MCKYKHTLLQNCIYEIKNLLSIKGLIFVFDLRVYSFSTVFNL